MTLECINPGDLPAPQTYSHVTVATGSRLVFVAGQVSENGQGNLVGPVTWPPRPGRRSPTSAEPWRPGAPGRTR